jgi:hypothetical protein
MKKVLIVAAAAGLMSLAACNPSTPAANEATLDTAANAIEETGDNLDMMADNATNATGEVLDNAADAMHDTAENVSDAATNAM